MKKIVAIIGSPRKGETYKAVRELEQKLKSYEEMDFGYALLKNVYLERCRGCGVCLEKGEEYCPLKDDRDGIFNSMMESDGIIFASPVYSLQVTALMKNFFDRLAYVFHRPCFFHKSCLPIVTQGFYGDRDVLKYLETVAHFWGFRVCPGLGITLPSCIAQQQKNKTLIEEAAERFYRDLYSPTPSPGINDLMMFRMIRSTKPFIADVMPRDYEYFKERGWLESPYFYDTKLNLVKRLIGAWADGQAVKLGKKMKKERVKFEGLKE